MGGNSTVGTISSSNSAAGAFVTYTAPAALPAAPDNNFVTITAQQPGTKGAAAGPATSPSILVYVVLTNIALISGDFTEGANMVFRLRGFVSPSNVTYGIIGRFHVDGSGNITNGVEDVNIAQTDGSSLVYTEVPFTGSYNMDTSSHGSATLTVTSPPWNGNPAPTPPSTMTLAFTMDEDAFAGKIIEADAGGTYAGSGEFHFQNVNNIFNSTSISGSFVFSIAGPAGIGAAAVHKGVVGRVDLTTGMSATTGTITSGSSDDESADPTQSLTGTYTLDGVTNDHGTITLAAGNAPTISFYVVNKKTLFALEIDPNAAGSGKGILLGGFSTILVDANGKPINFDNNSLAGAFIFSGLGLTPLIAANGQGHASAVVGILYGTAGGAAGAGTVNGIFDVNDGGTVAGPLTILGTNGQSPGSFTITANGRGIVNISAGVPLVTYQFVFYLGSLSYGVFLEQPASDSSKRGRSGELLGQTVGVPITIPATTFTFISGTRTDTAASLNSVAVYQENGGANPPTFSGPSDSSQVGGSPSLAVTDSGTLSITDQTNGRGTITATVGDVAGSKGAVFYVEDPAEVIIMGTDATFEEPQIFTLDQ